MQPIVIQNSRRRILWVLLVCLGFTAMGMFLVLQAATPSDRWTSWFVLLTFSAGLVLSVRQLMDSRPRLVIDEFGIYDRTLGVGRIPWPEITGARIQSIRGNDFVCLAVRDPKIWLHRLSPLQKLLVRGNRALGFSELNINLSGVEASTAQVYELILKFSEAARQNMRP